jgi:hypothetical protein
MMDLAIGLSLSRIKRSRRFFEKTLLTLIEGVLKKLSSRSPAHSACSRKSKNIHKLNGQKSVLIMRLSGKAEKID